MLYYSIMLQILVYALIVDSFREFAFDHSFRQLVGTYVGHMIVLGHRLPQTLMSLEWIVSRVYVLARGRWCRGELPFDVC